MTAAAHTVKRRTSYRIVQDCLREGLGVEDILVRHGIPIKRSRQIIRHLRVTGALSSLYEKEART